MRAAVILSVLMLQPILPLFAAVAGSTCSPPPVLSDGKLMRGGVQWVMRGVDIDGLGAPMELVGRGIISPGQRQAMKSFTEEVFNKAVAFGADTVRLPVSEPALRRSSGVYAKHYADTIAHAVGVARRHCLNVMLVMQWEPGAGMFGEAGMPGDHAFEAWSELLQHLSLGDHGLFLEVFNEPELTVSAQNWRLWQHETQKLIDLLRNKGFSGLIFVEGLNGGQTIAGSPPLFDLSFESIVYGIHVYFNSRQSSVNVDDWNHLFGSFCRNLPCVVTEWAVASGGGGPNSGGVGCNNSVDDASIAKSFLAYLTKDHIGLSVWALDYPDTLTVDHTQALTSLGNFSTCRTTPHPFGVGAMIHDFYKRQSFVQKSE